MNKQLAGEIVEIFYGINIKNKVVSVSRTRGGTLTYMGEHAMHTHETNGRNPKHEVSIVFNLSDIQSVSQALFGSEAEKKIIAELEAKAASVSKD